MFSHVTRKRGLMAAAAIAVSVLALSGCNRDTGGTDTSTGDDSSSDSGSSEEITIGFSQAVMNHPFRVAMVEGNVDWAAENAPEVTVDVLDAQDDAATQVTNMETLISQNVDAIILSPVTSDALTPVAQQAMEAGIPVITIDRSVDTEVTQHIGADNVEIAQNAGDYVVELTGGEGGILEIQGTAGSSAAIDRHEGFLEAIAGSNLTVVAETDANYELNKATAFVENNLQRFRNGEVSVVYAHNDAMALGARLALEEAGLADDVYIIGIDGENQAIEAVNEGRLTATFTYPFGAPEGIQSAIAAANGETLEPELVLESIRIDSSNAADYLGQGF
ncbi:MAG: substrate-binding domain-containing protein [Beutenbergiaceae bacterium]